LSNSRPSNRQGSQSERPAAAEKRAAPAALPGSAQARAAQALDPAPNSSFKPTLFLITGRMLAFAVTFFIPIVLSRIFDLSAFGTYKQVFLVYATLFGIAQVGMAESLYYFLPHDQQHAGRYLLNSMLLLALSGGLCLGLLYLGAGRVGQTLHNQEVSTCMGLLGVYLLLMLVTAVFEIAMISRNRYRQAALAYALSDVVRAVFLVVPVVVFRSLQGLLLGGIAFGVVRLAALLWYLHREFPGDLRFDWKLLRRQLAYALPFELAVIVEIAQSNFHSYAVSNHFSTVVFAIYAVGCLQLPFVDFVANPACNVMMVRMGEQLRAGRARGVLLLWHDTTRKLALIFVPMFVLLAISARQIIEFLFPAQYAAAVPIFMLWSATVVLAVFQTDGLMRVYARTGFLVFLNLIRLAVIVGLIGWCFRLFGLPGAVLVTLAATVVSKSLAVIRAKFLMRVSLLQVLPWRSLAAIAGVAGAAALPALLIRGRLALPMLVIGGHFALQKLAVLTAMGTAYLVCYVAMLWAFDLFNESEKLGLTGWLRRAATPWPAAGPVDGQGSGALNAGPADGD